MQNLIAVYYIYRSSLSAADLREVTVAFKPLELMWNP